MVTEVPSTMLNAVRVIVPNESALCAALIAIGERLEVPKGTVVLQEGNACRYIYFVVSGCIRVYTLSDGIEINTDFIFEGSFVTSLRSIRMGSASDVSFQAYEPSELYRFESASLLNLYKTTPGAETLGRTIVEGLLMRQEEHANMFRIFSGKERYQFLVKTKPEIIQRVSLSHIASYLGVARETLSRIRKP